MFFNNIVSEIMVLQFMFIYVYFTFFKNKGIYYSVFYFFLFIILFGFYLSIIQFDLMVAFLWLAEFVIVFISILFVFYLNIYSNLNLKNEKFFLFKYCSILIFFNIFNIFTQSFFEKEGCCNGLVNVTIFFENYYFNNYLFFLNDFNSFFFGYFFFNSVEYIIIGLLLLYGSLVSVNLYFLNKSNRVINYFDFFDTFNFFKNCCKFFFFRKQNLIDQLFDTSAIRFFKKKDKILKKKQTTTTTS